MGDCNSERLAASVWWRLLALACLLLAATVRADDRVLAVAGTDGGTVAAPAPTPAIASTPTPSPAAGEFKDCADCPDMVRIPGGQFQMGSPAGEAGRYDVEGPVHTVTVPPFAAGKYPVTRGQFTKFARATAYQADTDCDWTGPSFVQDDHHPVVCITWNDAKAYVAWLSQKTGVTYRLLTEAEYEYANRARSTSPYVRGDIADDICQFANVRDQAWYRDYSNSGATIFRCNDGYQYTSPVGHFPPNAFGLYDMTGNVLSWVEDCSHANYNGAPADGSAWELGNCGLRMLRGASWFSTPTDSRMAFRSNLPPTGRRIQVGFRLARSLK